MTEVKYLSMREELLYADKALSDLPSQVAIWIDLRWPRPDNLFGFDGDRDGARKAVVPSKRDGCVGALAGNLLREVREVCGM